MMLDSTVVNVVCRRALGCEWGGRWRRVGQHPPVTRQGGCKGVCRVYGRVWAVSDPELPKQRQRRALLRLVAVHLALVLEREPGWPHASKADRKAGVSRCGARAAAALEPRGPRHARTRALQAKRSALPLPGRQGASRCTPMCASMCTPMCTPMCTLRCTPRAPLGHL